MPVDTRSTYGTAGARPVRGPRRTRSPGAPAWIAMYHSVSDCADDPYRITVTPKRLDEQLRALRRRGLRGVSMRRLLAARAAGNERGLVGLTFDDGYLDFAENALPLLHRHDCGATVFVLPGRLGGQNAWDPLGPRKPLLGADDIRRIADAGVEIASHGLIHTDLTRADDRTLYEETAQSRALLAELTGRQVQGFCYPYGTVDERAVAAVRAAGYRYACAIAPGPLSGALALPRVHIGQDDTRWRLHLKRLLTPLRRPLPELPPDQGPEATATATQTPTATTHAPGSAPTPASASASAGTDAPADTTDPVDPNAPVRAR